MTTTFFHRIPKKYHRPLIIAPLLPLLVLLLWLSASRGIAGGIDYFIERALNRWSESNGPSPEHWQEAEELFTLAQSLSPRDPRLLARGAQLYEWGAWLAGNDRHTRDQHTERALNLHRQGLRVRPAWPYAWADFTAAKARAKAFDEEFQHAYQNAAQLGPWEAGVQLELARIGLQHWRNLSNDSRDQLRQVVENALAIQQRRLFAEVEKTDSLPLLCYAMEDLPKVFDHCQANHLY